MAGADVTIVIPQFGQCDLTDRAIRTFRNAHGPEPRVLVVDDGSDPAPLARLQSARAADATFLLQPHRGVTAAWNAGLQAADTPWLIFLNNDTLSRGSWVDDLLTPLRCQRARLAGVAWRDEPFLPTPFAQVDPRPRLLVGWCFALGRQQLLDLGGFDPALERYFSDTDLQLRLLSRHPESNPLAVVEGLPVEHIGHATAHRLPGNPDQWRRDRDQFLRTWHARGPASP